MATRAHRASTVFGTIGFLIMWVGAGIAGLTCDLHERSGAVFAVARGAAAVDPDVAALWSAGKQGHLADMTLLARSFEDAGLLPCGLDVGWATTTLYVLLGPETWHLVRIELQQDAEAYRGWLLSQLRQAFHSGSSRRHRIRPRQLRRCIPVGTVGLKLFAWPRLGMLR